MIPHDPKLVASFRDRLQNLAQMRGQNFEEILYRYAIERFLYRMSLSSFRDLFVLKGAQVFSAWGGPFNRPSRDIDLRGYTRNTVSHIEEVIRQICEQPVEPDGLRFDPESVVGGEISEDAEYSGIRALFWGNLGKARIRMQVDIGFVDVVSPQIVTVHYPTILGMQPPVLRAYPPESVISEKLQAIVYLGEINSRMKDYYDLWVLSRSFDYDGEILRNAIFLTFQNRNTVLLEGVPVGLTGQFARQKQSAWQQGFLLKLGAVPDELHDFERVITKLQEFLLPPLLASSEGLDFRMKWKKEFQEWVV